MRERHFFCLSKFLDGDTFITFETNQSTGTENVVGFCSYGVEVNFLLRSYATDTNIEAVILEFESLKQDSTESVKDFARSVRNTVRECGGVFSERELITRFQRGVRPAVRPIVRQ